MFGRRHDVVGIDMGSASVKVIEMKGEVRNWQVIYAGDIRFERPNADSVDLETLETPAVGPLRRLFHENGQLSRNAVSSLKGRPLMIQYLDFPSMTLEEMEAAVALEAGEFVTGDLDDMDMDFTVLPQAENADKTQVMLVMVPKEVGERRIHALRRAGLNPVVVDIDCLALANAYLGTGQEHKQGTVLILNVGATITNLCIMRNGAFVFARDIIFGGDQITGAVSKATALPEKEAEALKCDPSRWAERDLNMESVLLASATKLVEETRLCLHYCRSRGPVVELDRVLLTGGTARLAGLQEFLLSQLGAPIDVWSPFDDIRSSAGAEQGSVENGIGLFMSVAVGLAMR